MSVTEEEVKQIHKNVCELFGYHETDGPGLDMEQDECRNCRDADLKLWKNCRDHCDEGLMAKAEAEGTEFVPVFVELPEPEMSEGEDPKGLCGETIQYEFEDVQETPEEPKGDPPFVEPTPPPEPPRTSSKLGAVEAFLSVMSDEVSRTSKQIKEDVGAASTSAKNTVAVVVGTVLKTCILLGRITVEGSGPSKLYTMHDVERDE